MIPFRKTNVPRKHADPLELGHQLTTTHPLHAAQEWLRSGAELLILAGKVGTGKSFAAAKVLHDSWVQGATLNAWGKLVPGDDRLWIAAPHLARMTPWSDDVKALDRPDVLVLDDLGEEEATPKAISLVSTLITSRFSEGKRTIVTTNLDGSTFRERYGERIIDRLRECGLDANGKARWWVVCNGESLRGKMEPLELPRAAEEPAEPEGRSMGPGEIAAQCDGILRMLREDA